jgi:hypothetical protein
MFCSRVTKHWKITFLVKTTWTPCATWSVSFISNEYPGNMPNLCNMSYVQLQSSSVEKSSNMRQSCYAMCCRVYICCQMNLTEIINFISILKQTCNFTKMKWKNRLVYRWTQWKCESILRAVMMVYSLCIMGFSGLSIIQDSEVNTRSWGPDPIQPLVTKDRKVQISRVHFNYYSITVSQLILKSHLNQTPKFRYSNLPNQVHGLTPSHQMTEANAVFQTLCFVHNTKHCTKPRSSVLLTVCFRPSRSL